MSGANLVITLMYDGVDLEDEREARVLDRLMDLFPPGDPDRPRTFQMALSQRPFSELEERVSQWATRPGKEARMGLVKHGDGSVIPENEQQKTAAANGAGMSEGAREELARENAEADGSDAD